VLPIDMHIKEKGERKHCTNIVVSLYSHVVCTTTQEASIHDPHNNVIFWQYLMMRNSLILSCENSPLVVV
jgi:hypothetical protein